MLRSLPWWGILSTSTCSVLPGLQRARPARGPRESCRRAHRRSAASVFVPTRRSSDDARQIRDRRVGERGQRRLRASSFAFAFRNASCSFCSASSSGFIGPATVKRQPLAHVDRVRRPSVAITSLPSNSALRSAASASAHRREADALVDAGQHLRGDPESRPSSVGLAGQRGGAELRVTAARSSCGLLPMMSSNVLCQKLRIFSGRRLPGVLRDRRARASARGCR